MCFSGLGDETRGFVGCALLSIIQQVPSALTEGQHISLSNAKVISIQEEAEIAVRLVLGSA